VERPPWLAWADTLQTVASAGLAYSKDHFDRDRFEQVRRVAAEILAAHTDLSLPAAQARLAAEPGYVTPKVDVRAAVFDGDRVLLVRELADGRWSLPGGWADVGDSPAEVAAREVREEAGLTVRPVRLLAVLDRLKHPHPTQLAHAYKIFFLCQRVGGELRASVETPDVGWFARGQLPPLSLDRVLPTQVERIFQLAERTDLQPDFD
jgi:ADP-ribose pyrophosphatase YjhB (NUDIX family)